MTPDIDGDLSVAAGAGNMNAVERLLDGGADVNAKDGVRLTLTILLKYIPL